MNLLIISDIMVKTLQAMSQIKTLRKRYYKMLPGKEGLLKLVSETEISEQVYNSNAIENSTLSLKETEKILLQIDLDRYISEREIFEAKNLARVISYINIKAKEKELDFEMILLLHKMLISNIRDDIAGRFRKGDEYVKVANHIAPAPDKIEELLQNMLSIYYGDVDEDFVKRIAKLHLTFENIHPFVDGNGRIGRVINNYLLIRQGYVPINIKFMDRSKYYDAFKEFDKDGSTSIMEAIVAKALTNSYHKRLAYLENKEIITLSQYVKNNKLSHSNLLNKANRQTIPAFLENGIWKIGV
jgi:Fic family protein